MMKLGGRRRRNAWYIITIISPSLLVTEHLEDEAQDRSNNANRVLWLQVYCGALLGC